MFVFRVLACYCYYYLNAEFMSYFGYRNVHYCQWWVEIYVVQFAWVITSRLFPFHCNIFSELDTLWMVDDSHPLPYPAFRRHFSILVLLVMFVNCDGFKIFISSNFKMQIALMLAVLISKIARIDYPKEWYLLIFISLVFKNIYSVYNTAMEILSAPSFYFSLPLLFLIHCLS